MWELRRETITSLTFPLSILNDFNFTKFGQKKIEESANLLAEFVGDTANCKNIMKILKPKTGVRIFTTFLKEHSHGIHKDGKKTKKQNRDNDKP